ncbi:MAG TPA: DUF1616 domain-containing protein [Ktedonobacteraceae bacterium]|nr:DUF1616 domain-containing protein [Ktedonobacteraceae bacterium]
MRLKNLDLIGTMLIAVLNVVWALLPRQVPGVGIILALPLVFVLPGYILSEVLFHKHSFNFSSRLLLSLGLSLTIDVMSGFILNMLPGGLQALSWAVLLGLLTAAFSVGAAYLRRSSPGNRVRQPRFRFNLSGYMLFGLAMIVAIFSVLYALTGAGQQPYPGFTQLWMLPIVQTGKTCSVRLGVHNFETTPVTYRITMSVNGDQVTSWPAVLLASQGEWEHRIPIAPRTTDTVHVEAQLYRLDKPQVVYRSVDSTLYSCATTQVTPTGYPVLAKAYTGTMYDIVANRKTSISLTGLQQSQEKISGNFTAGTGSRSFSGNVTTTKQVQFIVVAGNGQASLMFEGAVQSDDTLSGSYCSLDQHGLCSNISGYGIWSAAPASP